MRTLLFFLSLLAAVSAVVAQAPPLAHVSDERYVLTVTGPGAYTFETTREVQVFSPAGLAAYGRPYVQYDGGSNVGAIEAETDWPGAKKPAVAKKRDREDYAITSAGTIADDARYVTLAAPAPERYPATVRTRTVREVDETVHMPYVTFGYPEGVTVGTSTLTIVGDLSEVLAHVVDPGGAIAVEEVSDTKRVYRYTGEGAGSEREDYAPSALLQGPAVLLAPRHATLGGKAGTFEDWDAMGRWTLGLLAERSALPEAAADEARALCADATTDRERVERVYRYMQQRTHYVGIQLGIGGFQPMDPADVHRLGYGDCKALTNYTRLLLDAVGVAANYCIVGARDAEIFLPEFASVSQANHAILGVPLPRDTMWLECTSQTDPADYSPDNWTAGRYVLWVDQAGSRLVRTEGLDPDDNTIHSVTTVDLAADPTRPRFAREATYRGTAVAFPLAVKLAAPQERARYVQGAFAKTISGLQASATVEPGDDGPVGVVRATGTLENYVQRVGARSIFPGFAFLPAVDAPADTLRRRSPVRFETSLSREDVLRVVLPEGPEVAGVPQSLKLEGPHATYSLEVDAPDTDAEGRTGYTMTRRLVVRAGTYPPASAAPMARFAREVARADSQVFIAKAVGP